MALKHLNDKQLMNLFKATNKHEVSPRGMEVLTELMTRGYCFDFSQARFLTFGEWGLRYLGGPPAPADYLMYVQKYVKQPHKMPQPVAG
jgi:hypothetical protein